MLGAQFVIIDFYLQGDSATSRLPYLALISALFALPTLSLAQTPPAKLSPVASLSKEAVLFDFEGGNFDGWTLTGDYFDKAPATPKTLVDKREQPLILDMV